VPHFTLTFEDNGPCLNVLLSVSAARLTALQKHGMDAPTPISIRGLVDTGASCTSVDSSVIQTLGISPSGEAQVSTPSTKDGPVPMMQYDVGLQIYANKIQHPLIVRNLPVIEAPLAKQGIHALIGRDVLSNCVLNYNGAQKTYTLAF